MFYDLAHSLKWNPAKCSSHVAISSDGTTASLRPAAQFDAFLGQATVLGLREYTRTEVHSWVVRLEQVRIWYHNHAHAIHAPRPSVGLRDGAGRSMEWSGVPPPPTHPSTRHHPPKPALVGRGGGTQAPSSSPSNFLVGVAPPGMDLNHSIGQEGCGIGLDYYGYIYIDGRYFHVSNLANWQQVRRMRASSKTPLALFPLVLFSRVP